MLLDNYLRLVQPQLRRISLQLLKCQKSHYDILGVPSTATQADVKSAYYKLSKIYHPDINQDSEQAAVKFRDITAAYEVLGNVKSRKLYDRGLAVGGVSDFKETTNKFYQSREVRSRAPAPHGRTTVYDFDEWSKAHYGSTLRRDLNNRRRQAQREEVKIQSENTGKVERLILFIGVMFMVTSAYVGSWNEYDIVPPQRTKPSNKE